MRPPLFVPPLTAEQQQRLRQGLRSGDAFTARPDDLWPMVLRRAGGTLALVATYPDDPALN